MRQNERIPVQIVAEYEDIARIVAEQISSLIRTRSAAGKRAVLGLATGSTPIGIYRELIRMHREEGLDLPGYLGSIEKELIQRALERTGGNRNRAAELLRIKRTTLVEKLKRLGEALGD